MFLALATGNSFYIETLGKNPMSSLFITELFNETKAPKVLLNVNGDKDVVKSLINDNRIKAVSFVGSTPVASKCL